MATTILQPKVVTETKKEIAALTAPVLHHLAALQITDADSYLKADGLLSRIRTARKSIIEKLSPIFDPIERAFKEMKEARSAVSKLQDELDAPLAQGELQIKGLMREYKMEEARQIAVAEDKKRQEKEKADRLLREAQEKEANARTAAMRARLAQKRVEAESKVEEVDGREEEAPVKAAASSTRTVIKWRVTDFRKVLQGVLDGKIPEEMVSVNITVGNQCLKLDKEEMRQWSGIEIYDDVQIVGRG